MILQIWAEALMYVRQGEKLYLSPEMDALAKDEQREAMESDEREGLVREYMDTLLPERWAEMDLFERRNFLAGSDFGNLQEKGTVSAPVCPTWRSGASASARNGPTCVALTAMS